MDASFIYRHNKFGEKLNSERERERIKRRDRVVHACVCFQYFFVLIKFTYQRYSKIKRVREREREHPFGKSKTGSICLNMSVLREQVMQTNGDTGNFQRQIRAERARNEHGKVKRWEGGRARECSECLHLCATFCACFSASKACSKSARAMPNGKYSVRLSLSLSLSSRCWSKKEESLR